MHEGVCFGQLSFTCTHRLHGNISVFPAANKKRTQESTSGWHPLRALQFAGSVRGADLAPNKFKNLSRDGLGLTAVGSISLSVPAKNARLPLKENAAKLCPQPFALSRPQARSARLTIEDHCPTNVVSKHRGVGDELNGHSQAGGADSDLNSIGEVDHSENFGIPTPASQNG